MKSANQVINAMKENGIDIPALLANAMNKTN